MVAAAIAASAVVGAGASMIAGGQQADAARDAANVQARTADKNLAFQQDVFNQTRADYAPFRDAGTNQLPKFVSGVNEGTYLPPSFDFNFQKTPGYDFRMQQGQKALDADASKNGMIFSGKQLKAADEFGQNFASNEYNNAFNQYNTAYNANAERANTQYNQNAALVDIGRNATSSTAQARSQLGSQSGQILTNAGNAAAQGYTAAGNAMATATGNIGGSLQAGIGNYLNMPYFEKYASGA